MDPRNMTDAEIADALATMDFPAMEAIIAESQRAGVLTNSPAIPGDAIIGHRQARTATPTGEVTS